MSYVSKRAVVEKAYLELPTIVLGPTLIGEGTIVGTNCLIGYPVRARVLEALQLASSGFETAASIMEALDEASRGARIGKGCVLRSGSVVYENVVLEDHVQLGHMVFIREETRVGEGTVVGTSTVVDGHVEIGKKCKIESCCYLPPLTKVGDNVFLGPGVSVTNDKYPPSDRLTGVTIGSDAVVGSRAVLVAGVTIGEGAVVGAGAVVTKDVEPYTVVVGVPAKPVGKREEYEAKKKAYERMPKKGDWIKTPEGWKVV